MCKAMDYGNELITTINKIVNRTEVLNKSLESLEETQFDLLHTIENNDKANVVQGYDLYKALHDVRVERRVIKSELHVLGVLNPKVKNIKTGVSQTVSKANEIDRKMKLLYKEKKYNNRILKLNGDIRVEIKQLIGREI